jgi:hypothetical protein
MKTIFTILSLLFYAPIVILGIAFILTGFQVSPVDFFRILISCIFGMACMFISWETE